MFTINSASKLFVLNKRNLLYLSLLLMAYLVIVFYFILPLVKKNALETTALKAEKSSLNYVMLYSARINAIKKETRLNNPAGKINTMKLSNGMGKSKSFFKYFKASLTFFGIPEKNIKNLYASYKAGGENIVLSLKSISLNQTVNVIYFLSDSGFNVKIKSLEIKRNFNDEKLLNLKASINVSDAKNLSDAKAKS